MPSPFTGVPVGDALASAQIALQAAGIDTPRLDAEVLLAHALGIDRTRLFLARDEPVEGAAVGTFRDLVRRRSVERVPVAYLTGTKGFRHLELQVDPRVLIPRPDTETLVEWAVEVLPGGARVVDVGTGSGAVALALKDERPDLDVLATDVSADALDVARANAKRLGLEVAFERADLRAGLPDRHVVSNPPYVEAGARLAPELGHEPGLALFAGEDGLDAYRALAASSGPPSFLLEVGAGQADRVRALFGSAWRTGTRRDLGDRERVVRAWRP